MLNHVVPHSVIQYDYNQLERPIAPGMKYKHYAPKTPVYMLTEFTQPISELNESGLAFVLPSSMKKYVPKDCTFISLCENQRDVKGLIITYIKFYMTLMMMNEYKKHLFILLIILKALKQL